MFVFLLLRRRLPGLRVRLPLRAERRRARHLPRPGSSVAARGRGGHGGGGPGRMAVPVPLLHRAVADAPGADGQESVAVQQGVPVSHFLPLPYVVPQTVFAPHRGPPIQAGR